MMVYQEDVVVYAAGDVMWLEDIKEKQEIEFAKQEFNCYET